MGQKKQRKWFIVQKQIQELLCKLRNIKKGEKDFHGVMVKGKLPILYHGLNNGYFVRDDSICVQNRERLSGENTSSLEEMSRNGNFYFKIGRNALSGFYHNVFPKLQEIADITEYDSDEIQTVPLSAGVFYFLSGCSGK